MHCFFGCDVDSATSLGGVIALWNFSLQLFLLRFVYSHSTLCSSFLSIKTLNNNNFWFSTFQLLLSPVSSCLCSSHQNMLSNTQLLHSVYPIWKHLLMWWTLSCMVLTNASTTSMDVLKTYFYRVILSLMSETSTWYVYHAKLSHVLSEITDGNLW